MSGILSQEEIERVVLEKVRVVSSMSLPGCIARRCDLRTVEDLHGNLRFHLETYIWGLKGETIEVHEYARWPRDWWQAFKERWFPGWAKRHWPVEYDELKVDVSERRYEKIYLDLDYEVPEGQLRVELMQRYASGRPEGLRP